LGPINPLASPFSGWQLDHVMKSIFKSKTAAIAFITALAGLVATFVPSVGAFVTSNAESILIGVGLLNVLLRKVTKDKVVIFSKDA
jgi:hypothetical protein